MRRVLVAFVLLILILFLVSCSKPTTGTGSRTEPTHPEGIIIDTTWHNDTIIHF